MAMRVAGHDVSVSPPDLAAAFPGATARPAVLLHGISDGQWWVPLVSGCDPDR
jgi:hypothetical protein